MMSSILSTSTTSAARAVAAAAVRLSSRRGGVRLRGVNSRIGHKASTPRHEATRIVFGAGVCGWGLPRSSSSSSIVVLASKTNEWRGPRDGGGKWTKKKKKKTATDGGGGGGKGGWRNGGGRGGGGGGVGDAPVKRRPRQFTDAQLEAIAALQAVADAGTVPTCALYKGKANIFLDGNPIVYGRACVDGTHLRGLSPWKNVSSRPARAADDPALTFARVDLEHRVRVATSDDVDARRLTCRSECPTVSPWCEAAPWRRRRRIRRRATR